MPAPKARTRGATSTKGSVASVSHAKGGGHHVTAPSPKSPAMSDRARWQAFDDVNPFQEQHMSDTHPLYRHVKFDDYEYREYPKLVYPNGQAKPGVQVHSEAEEAEAMSSGVVVRESDERARLIAAAGVYGVQADKRWSAARLTKAIEEAGFDPALDPHQ